MDSGARPLTVTAWLKWAVLIAGCTSLFAVAMRTVRTYPAGERWFNILGAPVFVEADKQWCEAGALLLCVLIGIFKPAWGMGMFGRAEWAFRRVASHPKQAIWIAGTLPVLIRLALLPVLPPPQPKVADEFGHLLIGDTFASGRLANPPHAMWRHFESLYVLQQPSYASIYPFAQGLLLAAAKVLHLPPWLAVYLSIGAMCGAICWMLQGWLTPAWALLGALLALSRFTILSYWMNTYWGGAIPAIGGALVAGALPRLLRRHRVSDTVPLAIGLALLSQSRPFEGFLLSLPVAAALLAWLGTAKSVTWSIRAKILICLSCASLAILAIAAYYNWRVTGSALTMPYQLHQKIYGTPQSFFWSNPIYEAPGLLRHKDILDNFHWQLKAYLKQSSWMGLTAQLAAKSNLFWSFYLGPLLTLPLLLLPSAMRDRWTRFLVFTAAFVLLGIAFYPFFYFHYAAPVSGAILFAVLQGMRRLRAFEWRSKPVGLSIFRSTVALAGISFAVSTVAAAMIPPAIVVASNARSEILERLRYQGGKHLVLVRYSAKHLFHSGEVYNAADIDRSAVVWARELDPASNDKLFRYYAGRAIWLFEPDEEPARFVPVDPADVYQSPPSISAILNAAGAAASERAGIAPGGIVTIFGRNFARHIDGPITLGSIFFPLPLQIDSIDQRSGNVYAPIYTASGAGALEGESIFSAPLPIELANVRVQFGSLWAPVYSVANIEGQESVTVQAPFELAGDSVSVTLWFGEYAATARDIPILRASPGVLQARLGESGLNAVVLKPDGSFAAADNPVKRGERVHLLVTGLGPLTPPVRTNQRGGRGKNPSVLCPVGVEVGGVEAKVISAKYAAELIGVEDVVFEVPRECPLGADVPVVVSVETGGSRIFSNPGMVAVF